MLFASFILAGCVEQPPAKNTNVFDDTFYTKVATPATEYGFYKITYEKHDYLFYIEPQKGGAIIHSESCSCKNK